MNNNNTGVPNIAVGIIDVNNVSSTTLLTCLKYVSRINPTKFAIAKVLKNTNTWIGYLLVLIFFPSLFKKILLVVSKVVLQHLCIIKGTINTVGIIPIVIDPTTESNTNIKFQKLSLFLRAWINSLILNLGYEIYNIIVALIVAISNFTKRVVCFFLLVICSITTAIATESIQERQIVALIKQVERDYGIPKGLLQAIAKVESSYKPYSVNIDGKTIIFADVASTKKYLQNKINQGANNIDIGVMQINYRWHGEKFHDLTEMLDPELNITYGAKLLKRLKEQHGNWRKAACYYHSATPWHHRKYSRKVILAWIYQVP